jgi:hypothetical protein
MSEIEEFLKRAAAMRARQQAAQAPPSPQPSPASARRVAPTYTPRGSSFDVQDAEVLEAEEVTGDDVAEYVTQHLDSSSFTQSTRRLGADIKSADEAIEAHLHQTFEHRLGQLGGMTAQAEDSTLDEDENLAAKAQKHVPALSFTDLLHSPQNLKNAIILAEILNPPHRRW